MSRYLLDTDVLIDYANGKEPVVSRIKGLIAQGDDLGLCAIAVAEFFAGLRPHQRDYWRRVLSTFVYWGVSFDAARRAGEWRYDFERRGISPPPTPSTPRWPSSAAPPCSPATPGTTPWRASACSP